MRDEPRLYILESLADMREVTLIVRLGKVGNMQFRLARWLMRLAGRIAGFNEVQFIRKGRPK